MDFKQGILLYHKANAIQGLLELGHCSPRHGGFLNTATIITKQKHRAMMIMLTSDVAASEILVSGTEPVSQPLLNEKIQSSINRGGLCIVLEARLELFQQLVGGLRAILTEQQVHDLLSLRRQTRPLFTTLLLGAGKDALMTTHTACPLDIQCYQQTLLARREGRRTMHHTPPVIILPGIPFEQGDLPRQ